MNLIAAWHLIPEFPFEHMRRPIKGEIETEEEEPNGRIREKTIGLVFGGITDRPDLDG